MGPKPHPGITHVFSHRSIAARITLLMAQSIIDPFCCVVLLFGLIFISFQPSINDSQIGAQYRIRLIFPGSITAVFFP